MPAPVSVEVGHPNRRAAAGQPAGRLAVAPPVRGGRLQRAHDRGDCCATPAWSGALLVSLALWAVLATVILH